MHDFDATSLGTVLAVWAHPDDEAYLSAGLMALAVDAGARVVCVTATRGEHGTVDPERWPPARLGALREREMSASLAALGVTEHHWLGIEDGACATTSPMVPVAAIARIMREVRPDTVVTFGPDGLTGHRDHRAVSRWTTQAWATNGAHGRLLYATCGADFVTRFQSVHERFSVFEQGLPTPPPRDNALLSISLDDDVLDRKIVALRAHASQTAGLMAAMGDDLFRQWCAEESFLSLPSQPPWIRRAALLSDEAEHQAA